MKDAALGRGSTLGSARFGLGSFLRARPSAPSPSPSPSSSSRSELAPESPLPPAAAAPSAPSAPFAPAAAASFCRFLNSFNLLLAASPTKCEGGSQVTSV